MLELILPAGVESEEVVGHHSGGTLFAEEQAIIGRAVEARRREFSTVRACARRCLERLGLEAAPILPGPGGAPRWPAGAVGSMTHCAGYAAAAVALSSGVSTIGIDAEPDTPLPSDVLPLIATPAERGHVASESFAATGPCWDRLLFSAKEAVYKAWFPLAGEELDFQDVDITFDADGGFEALMPRHRLVVDGHPLDRVRGRWLRQRGILVSALVISRGRSAVDAGPPASA